MCAGLLGGPGIGFNQDTHAARQLIAEHPDVYKRYATEAPNTFLFFQTTGLDGAKVGVLDDDGADLAMQVAQHPDDANAAKLNAWWATAKATAAQDKPIVTDAELHGSKMALQITARIPMIQAFLLLCILIYFRSKGGYKQIHIEGEGTAAREVA